MNVLDPELVREEVRAMLENDLTHWIRRIGNFVPSCLSEPL